MLTFAIGKKVKITTTTTTNKQTNKNETKLEFTIKITILVYTEFLFRKDKLLNYISSPQSALINQF